MSSTTEKRKPGRPRLAIDPQAVVDLRRAPERWTWEQIAGKLGVSSDTVMRAWSRRENMKALETSYANCRFRSRLEARWARFFDKADVEWEYEKEGYLIEDKPYLPDFWLPYYGVFIEIKGDTPSVQEKDLVIGLRDLTGYASLIFHGLPGQYVGHMAGYDEHDGSGGAGEYPVCISGDNEMSFFVPDSKEFRTFFSSQWQQLKTTRHRMPGAFLQRAMIAAKRARFEFGESG